MSYRTHRILNIILALLYTPFCLIAFLMGMATEGTIGETNPLIIASCYTLAHCGMLTSVTAHAGLFVSDIFYKKGNIRISHIARFWGPILFGCGFLSAFLLDWLARLGF